MLKTYPKSWIKINNKGGYFEDTNYKVEFTKNTIQITNLKNASNPNDKCEVITFTTKEDVGNWRNNLSLVGIPSFTKLVKTRKIEGFKLTETVVNSNDVYSPFVEVDVKVINEGTKENVVETDTVVDEVELTADTNQISSLPTKIGIYDVLEDSNIELTQTRGAYFKDINCLIQVNNHEISIEQLPETTTNVECKVRRINLNDFKSFNSSSYTNEREVIEFFNVLQKDNSNKIIDGLNKQGIYTFKDLFNAEKIRNSKLTNETVNSSNVFSPFVKVRRISKTDNFTSYDLYKAIVNGQIFYGYEESKYEYLGTEIDLFSLAKEIKTSCSSDMVIKPISTQGNIMKLEVTSFINKMILYYDKSCSLKYVAERFETLNKQISNNNHIQESEVLELTNENIKPNSVYSIEYIKGKNCVGEIVVEEKLVFADNFEQYQVLNLVESKLDDNRLYTIADSNNKLVNYDIEDTRIIEMDTNYKIATGFAINEFLSEGVTFPMIELSSLSSIADAKDYLKKSFNLKFQNNLDNLIFSFDINYANYIELVPNDIDYYKSVQKLNDEEEMLIDNANMLSLESKVQSSYVATILLPSLTNIYN